MVALWLVAIVLLQPKASGDVEGPITSKVTDWTVNYVVAESYSVTPRSYLRQLAGDDFEVLNCIATKESGWKMQWNYMHDIDPKKYTAYGYFQILESTARHVDPKLDRMDQWENIQLGVKLYQQQGITPWLVKDLCSKYEK